MALITPIGALFWPPVYDFTVSNNGDTLNATGQKVAQIFTITESGTLDKFEFDLRNFTQCTNGLKVSFQDLDASGNPDGVADQFRVVTVTGTGWITPGLITSDGTDGGTKRTVTVGQVLACVIEFSSFAAGDSVGVAQRNVATDWTQTPAYKVSFLTGSWGSKSGNSYYLALKYDSGYCPLDVQGMTPVTGAQTNTAYNSGSTPDERGMLFQVPTAMTIAGAWMYCNRSAAADLVLYDTDGTTVLVTSSLDSAQRSGAALAFGAFYFPPTALTANVGYRLTLKPTSGSNVTLGHLTVNSSALLAAFTGGSTWMLTTRTDAGAWTDTNTARPMMGLIISGFNTTSAAERQHAWASFG